MAEELTPEQLKMIQQLNSDRGFSAVSEMPSSEINEQNRLKLKNYLIRKKAKEMNQGQEVQDSVNGPGIKFENPKVGISQTFRNSGDLDSQENIVPQDPNKVNPLGADEDQLFKLNQLSAKLDSLKERDERYQKENKEKLDLLKSLGY